MKKMSIIARNTHFVVTIEPNVDNKRIITRFNNNLITYKTLYLPHKRKMVRTEDRRYYYKVGDDTYHYSIHLLKTFIKQVLNYGIPKEDIELEIDRKYTPRQLEAKVCKKYTDRPHQPLYINKALKTKPIVLVDLKTGKGKTYISMRVATKLGYATGIIVLSRYIDKWIRDVKELTTVKDDMIYVVKGKDSLTELIEGDKDYDFIIFSLSTLRNYIKSYDANAELVNIPPEYLMAELGIGLLMADEVHQSFHAGYMVTIRVNPIRVLSLSATLDTLDAGIKNMYATLYPEDARCGNLVEFKPHPDVIAVNYRIHNPERVRHIGPRGYSHVLFEQSIMRNSRYRNPYMDMILYYVNRGYIDRRRKDDKILILVQTIKMAGLVTNFLRSKIKGLSINRYVEEDPYENVIGSDICVSTNQSAGVALDIPSLITVIQTVSMGSLQANVQALGRLREIKGIDVRYYYTYSSNLKSHQKLHNTRREVTYELAKSYITTEYPVKIG